jgi:hypothetical protein
MAPTISSSKPSPLMSRAIATEMPAVSRAFAPMISKPLLPLRLETFSAAGNAPLCPNTTNAAPEL